MTGRMTSKLATITVLTLVVQLCLTLNIASPTAATKVKDLEDILNNPNPTYFERFERAAHVVSLARDANFRKKSFQFESEVANGLKSLVSASTHDDFWEAVRAVRQHEKLLVGDGVVKAYAVSPLCVNHTGAILTALLSEQPWAAVFLDAMGKPPAGLLQGGRRWPGAYEECLQVRVNSAFLGPLPPIAGTYCTMALNRPSTPMIPFTRFDIGLCIPDSCSGVDMKTIINEILVRRERKERVNLNCIPEEHTLDHKAIVAIVLLTCMAMGTALDVLYVQMPKWRLEAAPSSVSTNGHSVEETLPLMAKNRASKTTTTDIPTGVKLLVSFSVYTNTAKMLSTNQPAGSLNCVHGIRFLSMTWVVLGHAFSFIGGYSGNEYAYSAKIHDRWTFQAIANATVSVDSFFVLSGLLVAYLSLKEMKKKEGKLNWFLFYFHRFWRLTPAYMLVIMVFTCLSPYWGSGPFWPGRHIGDRPNCEENWWTNLLYVNNLVESKKMCLGQSWYLANDMQFYVLSPLIFVPFYFSPILGCISSGLFLLGTVITPGVVERNHYFSPGSFAVIEGNHRVTESSFTYYYIKPWNRMGPYVIGLMAGYVLYRSDCKLRINKFLNLFLWTAATGTAMGILYGLYDASNGHPMSIEMASFYVAVHRTVWGVCVAWVVIACCTGNGGFVNTLLSWSGLVPMSRLTYCIYLLHIMFMDLYMMNQHTLFYMSDINIVMFFIGILIVSYMSSFITSLAFEAPMMGLEKVIFRRDTKKGEEKEKTSWKHTYANTAANITETKLAH